jgi:hypothetical protein
MVLGFTGLITITTLAYRNAPPIPALPQKRILKKKLIKINN